jgi:hypothetical protein
MDYSAIIVAGIAFIGTCLGTIGGIIASARLTNYRLAQLEEKVGKHNNFAERMPVIEEQIKVINHRIEDLEKQYQ